ncbi:hypothetical protein CN553_22475 [Bacillus cereus]|uniref:Chitin-binding type-3 domain-containing protein n=1 Tax=Bacillus cereus TaxID=1396 RepID=A0A9X6U8I8_BACCE|nr:hypothetical protein [Bacillus cereus]PEN89772.1 hypothetical protein CN553_22475 [Bacillus cereus]
MMKNKKRQIGKGIVLATVLGLGWGVAGDISHAAGNNFSQKKIPAEWKEKEQYSQGAKVSYKGTQYKLVMGIIKGLNPDEYSSWEIIGGKIPEWSAKRVYSKGEKVSYKGIEYEATEHTYNYNRMNPAEDDMCWKALEGTTSQEKNKSVVPNKIEKKDKSNIEKWSVGKSYPKDTIVMHEGRYYKALYHSYLDLPTPMGEWTWKLVNKDGSDINVGKALEGTTSQAQDKSVVSNEIVKPTWVAVDWGVTKTYAANCKVLYKGIQYQSKRQTTSEPGQSNDWKAITQMEI